MTSIVSIITKLYWLIPFVLVLLQGIYTFNSNSQIRWEEMELLRDNYWFAHHLIWSSGYSSFGTYGTVNLVNSLFGFHLFNYKYFKLFFSLISLFCAAALLKRYLGVKPAIIPLLTFGLSPTLLFFNVLQAPYGIDLSYFPILLYLVLTNFKNNFLELAKLILFWMLLMWGWLSYPAVAFYIPVLAIIFLMKLRGRIKTFQAQVLAVSVVAFLIPLIFSVLWVQNRDSLFDFKQRHGLFITGGTPIIENSLEDTFSQALAGLVTNLFIKATAYHYEVNQVEFSGILPIFALALIIIVPFWYRNKAKEVKLPNWLCLGLIILNIILSSIAVWSGIGFRRYTPILMAIYCLLAINFYLFYTKRISINLPKWFISLSLCLLLVHHIIVYPINLIHLQDPSPFRDFSYFTLYESPERAVEQTTSDLIKGDVHLNCQQQFNLSLQQECPYLGFYTAVMSACFWNKQPCQSMYGYSSQRKQEDLLNMELFSKLLEQQIQNQN